MEWINVIVPAICAILGALGGGTLLYFRQTKKQKDIDNELKEAEAWEKLYHEKDAKCTQKDSKIDELRRDINRLQEERINIIRDKAEEINQLQGDISCLNTKLVECNWYRCERCGCKNRKPKREIDIPTEGGGYED